VSQPSDSDPGDHLYRIPGRSLTKILTATGIVSMLDDANRTLDAPLSSWYPAFQVADQHATATATMRHSSPTAVVGADTPWPEGDVAPPDPRDVAGDISAAAQVVEPGALFNYSNSSFLLAGHILATRTGLPYEEVSPPGFSSPSACSTQGSARPISTVSRFLPVTPKAKQGLSRTIPGPFAPAFNPAGGLLSTVDDMLRFVSFFAGILPVESPPITTNQRLSTQLPHGPGGSLGRSWLTQLDLAGC
jgi:CubicO group peptidase (beta-lactamase class C family)